MYNGNALAWENILVILAVKNGQVKSGATRDIFDGWRERGDQPFL
jgi:hypothetical protein